MEAWRKILGNAADRIDQYGWTQHGTGKDGNACCAMIAMHEAAGIKFCPFPEDEPLTTDENKAFRDVWKAKIALRKYIQKKWGTESIVIWNDYHVKNREEVTETLRKVANEQV